MEIIREPHNSRQTFMNGLIEIHTDWFQTLEQARQFANSAGTYICHYTDRWSEKCRSRLTSFTKWEFVYLNGTETMARHLRT